MKRDRAYIAKNLSIVSGGTLVSRILGFIRDMVIANYFGTSLYADTFFVAFRIPNLLRRLLGEGALTASFIPVFSQYLKKEDKNELKKAVNASFTTLFLILVGVVALGEIFAPQIIKAIAPGFSKEGEKLAISISILRAVFPYILFISLVALSMGVLNSLGHFFAPSIAPSLLNVSMILSVTLTYKLFHPPVFSLCLGVIAGGVLQLLLQLPFLKKEVGFIPGISKNLLHPVVKESAKLMTPAFLGIAAAQLNIFIGTVLASFLPTGSISFLYYADRLFQFPVGVFSIALGTVVLPLFSKKAAESLDSMKESLLFSLRLSFFISVPAAIGLILLNIPIISTLFLRGRFNINSMVNTGYALIGYSIGIPALSGVKVLVPGFYSLKDTKTPFMTSFATLIVNAGLGLALLKPLKHFGLALATSAASWVNLVLLARLLEKKVGKIDIKSVSKEIVITLLSSLPLALICILSERNWHTLWFSTGNFLKKAFLLLSVVLVSVTLFFLLALILKARSAKEIYETVRERFPLEKGTTRI